MGVRASRAPGQVPAHGPRGHDAALVRDAGFRGIPYSGKAQGGHGLIVGWLCARKRPSPISQSSLV